MSEACLFFSSHYEIFCVLLLNFRLRLRDCMILLHNFRTRYPDEISCFFGPLRALRLRFQAFWLPNLLFVGVMYCTSTKITINMLNFVNSHITRKKIIG